MGMFDSLYGADSSDWQTKAYDCELDHFRIGDLMPSECFPHSYPSTYQVEILGETAEDPYADSLATIRCGVLASVHDRRDTTLALLDYSGYLIEEGI